MTQYRLLERSVDTIEATDEFWDGMKRQWSVVPDYLVGQLFVGTIPYRRAIPEPELVENSNEWVMQDRVPARPGIDQAWWQFDHYSPSVEKKFWNVVESSFVSPRKHGSRDCDDIATLHLRCRRKDLPPVPPKPTVEKIVLKEWVCWENANPECKWLAWCAVSPAEPMDTQANWDNAVPTGQEREIEVPV